MSKDLRSLKKYWKKISKRRITESGRASNKPCFLYFASITANTTGPAGATLRDGHSVRGEAIIDLAADVSSLNTLEFNEPLYFDKGLYVDLGNNVTSVLVQFLGA